MAMSQSCALPLTIPSIMASETRLFTKDEHDHTLYPACLKRLVVINVVVVLPMVPVIPIMSTGIRSLTISENSSFVRTFKSESLIFLAIGADSGK